MALCCISVRFHFLFMFYKSIKKIQVIHHFLVFVSLFQSPSARIVKKNDLCLVYVRFISAVYTERCIQTRVHVIPLTRQTKHPVTFECIEFRVDPPLHSEWKVLQHGHCTAHFHALVLHNAASFHQMIGPS